MKNTFRHLNSTVEKGLKRFFYSFAFVLFFALGTCLAGINYASAGSDLTVSSNKTLTSKFNKYDNVTVKKGVTLTLAERTGEPVGLEVAQKLVVEDGAKITGYGLIIFDKNAAYEGISLYYKFNGEFCRIPTGMNFSSLGSGADYKPTFEYNKQKCIYVLMEEFNGGDPFQLDLNRHQMDLIKGETFQLSLSGITEGVTFKSGNKKIAVVDKNGVVNAKKTGNTIITAKYDGKEYKCEVNVVKKGLSSNQVFMDEGEKRILQLNGAELKKVKSSNKKVAKISKDLEISAVGEGKCTLYVYDTEGNKYTCKVQISKRAEAIHFQ